MRKIKSAHISRFAVCGVGAKSKNAALAQTQALAV